MLHGPLQFVSGPFFEHWFYPEDYEQMLGLSDDRPHVRSVLKRFEGWCSACQLHDSSRCNHDTAAQHRPAVCMMAFLQDYVFKRAAEKDVLVCGVIERSFGRSITKYVVKRMLEKEPEVFSKLLESLSIDSNGLKRPGFHVGSITWKPRTPGSSGRAFVDASCFYDQDATYPLRT